VTVSPVFLPAWRVATHEPVYPFTTVMQWDSYDSVNYDGIAYGNKSHEFPRFTTVPRRTQAEFFGMIGRPRTVDVSGWQMSTAPRPLRRRTIGRLCRRPLQNSLSQSKGAQSSRRVVCDRSVCYLAGRPVVVQDQGCVIGFRSPRVVCFKQLAKRGRGN
jgi:hypothetical protein